MSKAAASLPEEALEKVIAYVDGPLNRRAERLLKSRLLLAPAGLLLTLGFRSLVAARDGDLGALLGRRRRRGPSKLGGAR
jgi:hypothetical protein